MPENVYYHATLIVNAPFIVSEDKKRGGVKVALGIGDKPFPLIVKKKWAAIIEANPPEGEQSVILWPRTDKEGLLGSGTQLALYKPVGEVTREPGLHALGELVKVDRENALLQIQIFPNEGQGSLKKPFKLPLVASLEILDSLPEVGTGLEVWADLKQRTGRMVITRVQAVPLPPKRVVEPETPVATGEN
jgi:hypothetical protein